jgi:hypothetical protein
MKDSIDYNLELLGIDTERLNEEVLILSKKLCMSFEEIKGEVLKIFESNRTIDFDSSNLQENGVKGIRSLCSI